MTQNANSIDIVMEIPHNCTVKYATEYGLSSTHGKDGLIIKHVINGHVKYYVLSFGMIVDTPTANGLYASGGYVYVLANGNCYRVNAEVEDDIEYVKHSPIYEIVSICSKDAVILCATTTMHAYSGNISLWNTKRISYDRYSIIGISKSAIRCKAYDLSSESDIEFEIRLEDGLVENGLSI